MSKKSLRKLARRAVLKGENFVAFNANGHPYVYLRDHQVRGRQYHSLCGMTFFVWL
jgi:hypothetical protein